MYLWRLWFGKNFIIVDFGIKVLPSLENCNANASIFRRLRKEYVIGMVASLAILVWE